jgi:uncharacterized membrane protein
MQKFSRAVFLSALALCLLQAAYYYPLLPDRVASHFGSSGRPDAWSGKSSFVGLYLVVIGIVAFLLPMIGARLSKVPDSRINLPNKDYWLSPERRQETFDVLSRYFLWLATATLLLMLDVFHQAFRVHLGKSESLGHPVLSIAIYAAFAILWSIRLIAKFSRK